MSRLVLKKYIIFQKKLCNS